MNDYPAGSLHLCLDSVPSSRILSQAHIVPVPCPPICWALTPTPADFCHSGAGYTCQNWCVSHLKVELLTSLELRDSPGLFLRYKSSQLITGPSAVPFCSTQMVFHHSGAGHTCQNWWVIHLKVELSYSLDSVFQDPSHSSCHFSSSPVPLLEHALNPSVFLQLRHKPLH